MATCFCTVEYCICYRPYVGNLPAARSIALEHTLNSEDLADRPSHAPVTSRRCLLKVLTSLGVGGAAFQRALAHQVDQAQLVTTEMVQDAEWIAGITLSNEQRDSVAAGLQGVLQKRRRLRSIDVDHETLPCLRFDPEMYATESVLRDKPPEWLSDSKKHANDNPQSNDEFSFLSISQLGKLLRSGETTSVTLTEHFLSRLKEVDPILKCAVTLTEELAMKQARRADDELSTGKDRGPLHGIPWGAKDLVAVADYPTTWGAPQFKQQVLPETATVAKKLENAGAVLIAKLSLGALAMGDKWFGGQTRNPQPGRGPDSRTHDRRTHRTRRRTNPKKPRR